MVEKATEVLNGTIRQAVLARGEDWTEDLAVKVTQLNTMRYWDEADAERFRGDYDFLRSTRRHPPAIRTAPAGAAPSA